MWEALSTAAGMMALLLGIWWAALIVLVIKGWLFHRNELLHRNETAAAPEISDDPEMAAELATLPPPPRGCVWAFIIFVWPLALAIYLDRQSDK